MKRRKERVVRVTRPSAVLSVLASSGRLHSVQWSAAQLPAAQHRMLAVLHRSVLLPPVQKAPAWLPVVHLAGERLQLPHPVLWPRCCTASLRLLVRGHGTLDRAA